MSNALLTATLLDAIRVCVVAAWGNLAISYGQPRTPLAAPYCVIYADSVGVSFGGQLSTVGNTSQENSFTINGRFAFPSDPTQIIDLLKIGQANNLIGQLQASSTFAGGTGLYPIVTMIDFTEPDDPNERAYEVTLTFAVLTQASHH